MRFLHRPDHSKRTRLCPVFFVDRHYSECREKADLYTGSRMIGETQLSVTAMRPRSKREALDDSLFISPEHRNRLLATDGETNCTNATRSRSTKDKRLTSSQREKYTRMIDRFPRNRYSISHHLER